MENSDIVGKHIRKIRKKLRQIEHLEVIDRPLNPEEQLKVNSKVDLRDELHQLLEEHRIEDFNLIKQPSENRYDGEAEHVSGKESEDDESESTSFVENKAKIYPQKKEEDRDTEFGVENEATTGKGKENVGSQQSSHCTKSKGNRSGLNSGSGCKDKSNPWKDSTYWVYTLEGHNDIILDVDIFENYVISSSRDTTAKVWKIGNDSELLSLRGHHAAVTSIAFLPTSLADVVQSDIMMKSSSGAECHIFAVSGGLDCMLKVWDVITGENLKTIYTYNGITCIACGPQYVVTGTEGGRLEVWCLKGQRLAYTDAFTGRVAKVKITEDKLYAGSVEGDIGIWEISTDGKNLDTIFSLVPDGSTQLVLNHLYALDVNKNALLLGDNGPNIKSFTWTTGVLEKYANHIGDIGMTDALTMTADNHILSASYFVDGGYPSINVRNADTMEYICTITDLWEGRILCLAATEGVCVSGGHYLKVWVQKSKHERPHNLEQAEVVLTSFVKQLTDKAQDSGTDESDWTVSEDEEESYRRLRSLKPDNSKESSWWCTMV